MTRAMFAGASSAGLAPERSGVAGHRPRGGRRAESGRTPRSVGQRRQRGQALVLGLGLLLACGIAFYASFDVAQAVSTKQRLVNASDAAALGAATWRARSLNFAAYANRAIVANEVAVAQAATLDSWTRYFATLVDNAETLGTALPAVRPVLTALSQFTSLAAGTTRVTAQAEVAARSAQLAALRGTQKALVTSAQSFALGAVANEIARANDPSFFAHMLANDDFGRLTHGLDGRERRRLLGVIEASFDPFTGGARKTDITLPLPTSCLLRFDRTSLQSLRKRGATAMTDDLERWESQDTLSWHTARSQGGVLGIGGRCREAELLPLGWGAAQVAARPAPRLSMDRHEVGINDRARRQAEGRMDLMRAYAGLSSIEEIDYAALADPRDPRSTLAVLARAESESIRSARRMGLASARLSPAERLSGGRLWSLSAAEVGFMRPEDGNGRIVEYGSLFNPYWQARLAEPSPGQRAEAEVRAR